MGRGAVEGVFCDSEPPSAKVREAVGKVGERERGDRDRQEDRVRMGFYSELNGHGS